MEFAFARKFFVEGWLQIDTIQQHNFMMCNKFLFAFISYDSYVTVIGLFTDNDSFYNYISHYIPTFKLTTAIIVYWFWMWSTVKALWDSKGKIKMYHGMPRVKKQLPIKRSIVRLIFFFSLWKNQFNYKAYVRF